MTMRMTMQFPPTHKSKTKLKQTNKWKQVSVLTDITQALFFFPETVSMSENFQEISEPSLMFGILGIYLVGFAIDQGR